MVTSLWQGGCMSLLLFELLVLSVEPGGAQVDVNVGGERLVQVLDRLVKIVLTDQRKRN